MRHREGEREVDIEAEIKTRTKTETDRQTGRKIDRLKGRQTDEERKWFKGAFNKEWTERQVIY